MSDPSSPPPPVEVEKKEDGDADCAGVVAKPSDQVWHGEGDADLPGSPLTYNEDVDLYHADSPEMQAGFRGRLDEDMVGMLTELRGMIDQETIKDTFIEGLGGIYADDVLLRFLRATKWNVKESFARINTTLEWRRTFLDKGVGAITISSCQKVVDSGISFFCGVDKFGHPIAYTRVKLYNKKHFTTDEMRAFTIWCFEAGRALIVPPVQMCGLVFDMTGFGLSNMDYDYVKFLIATFRDYYPESLGIGLVVGAPFIFKACWKIIKPMMDPITVGKIHFIDRKDLTKYIPKSQLHTDYGGDMSPARWPSDPPLPGTAMADRLAKSAPPPITTVGSQYESPRPAPRGFADAGAGAAADAAAE